MARQPDRFSRIVYRHNGLLDYGPRGLWLSADAVVRLLSKEHLAVVRMVRKELARSRSYYSTRTEALQRVLDKLNKRAKW